MATKRTNTISDALLADIRETNRRVLGEGAEVGGSGIPGGGSGDLWLKVTGVDSGNVYGARIYKCSLHRSPIASAAPAIATDVLAISAAEIFDTAKPALGINSWHRTQGRYRSPLLDKLFYVFTPSVEIPPGGSKYSVLMRVDDNGTLGVVIPEVHLMSFDAMSAAEWKSADWATFADGKAAFKAVVYNAFARAVNERMHVLRDGPEMLEWVVTSTSLDPRVPPQTGYIPVIGATYDSAYDPDGAGPGQTQFRMVDSTAGTYVVYYNTAWQSLQACVHRLRWFYIDLANPLDDDGTPQSLMQPDAAFPAWRRKYPREIVTLADAGTSGQRARFCMDAWAYAFGSSADRFLTGRIFEHDGSTWTLVDDFAAEPDTVEAEGLIRSGDYIGPWILDDLREAIQLLQRTVTGTEFGTGNGTNGTPNLVPIGNVYHVVKEDGTGRNYPLAIVRHNTNRYLRTTVSGRNGTVGLVAGNWNGTSGECGDCYYINAGALTGTQLTGGPPPYYEAGYGRQAADIFATLWSNIQHSTPWRRRNGTWTTTGGGIFGDTVKFGTVSYNYTNTDYPPPTSYPSAVSAGNTMLYGFGPYCGTSFSFSMSTQGAGGTSYGYNISDKTGCAGGGGNAVLSDTILFPYGMRARIYQYAKAEAPAVSGETEFNAFGTPLQESAYALLGTHDDAEYELDESTILTIRNKVDGTIAAVDAKLGPDTPPSSMLPTVEYVADETRAAHIGYETKHVMRIYDWAVEGGFEYV